MNQLVGAIEFFYIWKYHTAHININERELELLDFILPQNTNSQNNYTRLKFNVYIQNKLKC